jgi:hypothetical protein
MAKLMLCYQRIEPFGWDREERTYIVLDDNRLYRRTDPPPPPPPAAKPKKNSKKAKAALRASKRRKISEPAESEAEQAEETNERDQGKVEEDDGFGGMIWECLAVTLDEMNAFIASIEKSKDPDEKVLHKRIVEHLLPLLEKQEEARKRKAAQKERELLNLEKLATAKRSSRIAGKLEQQKQEEGAREAERKRQAELAMAKKEQEKWQKLEKERESRMMTREQRVKEREARRILHEEELANLSEDSKKLESGGGRLSERHLKAEIEKKKQALEDLAEEEDWIFDCICGVYGQVDDGTHSLACEKCNIWQHSKCAEVSETDADREDFHFICKTCERRAKDAERAKTHPPIKIKINRPGSSSSPMPPKQNGSPAVVIKTMSNGNPSIQSPSKAQQAPQTAYASPVQYPKPNGPPMASWQTTQKSPPHPTHQGLQGNNLPPTKSQINGQSTSFRPDLRNSVGAAPNHSPSVQDRSSYSGPYGPYQNSGSPARPPQSLSRPASAHAFSSPHPYSPTSLPPPGQPQVYTFVNGNTKYGPSLPNAQPAQSTPSHQNPLRFPVVQNSPSAGYANGAPPAQSMNGPRPGSSDAGYRRSSINLPPLVGAPVLTPSTKNNPVPALLPFSSPLGSSTPAVMPGKPSPSQAASSPIPQATASQPSLQEQDPSQASALPPAATGLSPTKHSPPRPTTSNGSFGSATPSMLPPVASLSPSPQMQNLTPPVKQSEPEWNRPTGQSFSSQ